MQACALWPALVWQCSKTFHFFFHADRDEPPGPLAPLCFLFFVFSHPPTTSNVQGRPLTERSKNYRPGGMKRASTEASQSRWSRNPCGGCMAANFANNGILEGPKKCARCDPGRNHYRELQQETERIAACRERRLRKEANRLAKHRRLAPEQSRRSERSSEASGPTVTTAEPKGKGASGCVP